MSMRTVLLLNKINRRFEVHLLPHHQGCDVIRDEDRDGPRNVVFFYSSDATDCPKILLNPVAAKASDHTLFLFT
jgi:hypothetical protein